MTAHAIRLASLEAIVFDFDGVILESAALKGQAFLELFADYPEHLERIRSHHLDHLGVSRFDKFDWIYEKLLGRPLPPAERERLGERYSELVFEKAAACPFVPGMPDLLERLHGRMPLFVASATPQAELEALVARRELDAFFTGVRGSPPAKGRILIEILAARGLEARRVLMIGDGLSDLHAAREAGCLFLARLDEAAPEQAFPAGTPGVRTMVEASAVLC